MKRSGERQEKGGGEERGKTTAFFDVLEAFEFLLSFLSIEEYKNEVFRMSFESEEFVK